MPGAGHSAVITGRVTQAGLAKKVVAAAGVGRRGGNERSGDERGGVKRPYHAKSSLARSVANGAAASRAASAWLSVVVATADQPGTRRPHNRRRQVHYNRQGLAARIPGL